MSCELLSNSGKVLQHPNFQKSPWGYFLSTPSFSELGVSLSTMKGHFSFLISHPIFPFLSSCSQDLPLAVPAGTGEQPLPFPPSTVLCAMNPRRRRGPMSHGDNSEPPAQGAAWGCLPSEGNFRKVKNESLDFIGVKRFLAAPLQLPRWTLAALLLCWRLTRFSTHRGRI